MPMIEAEPVGDSIHGNVLSSERVYVRMECSIENSNIAVIFVVLRCQCFRDPKIIPSTAPVARKVSAKDLQHMHLV